MKKLFVIDGHALCYRAYYAFINNPLINSKGQNISAIFGFARMLYKLIDDQKPDYLVVAFDPPKSFRFDLYPEYKANRVKMPDDLRTQIEEIKNMVIELGLARIEQDGFEADDVLGTIAKNFAGKDTEVYLVTGDKDAYQLVNSRVKIYANKKGISDYELYDESAIEQKLGLRPDQVTDYMALMGDASDNVPGVKGVGEKTALKLIEKYGSLDAIYEHIDEITGKQKEMLAAQKEMAYLSKELVTIRTDAPIHLSIGDLTVDGLRSSRAREYFKSLEMHSLVTDYFGAEEGAPAKEQPPRNYVTVMNEKELKAMVDEIRAAGITSIDTETTSLSTIDAEVVGVSFSIRPHQGWYVPLVNRGLFSEEYLDRNASIAILKPLIEDAGIKKVGQNIKYDLNVLRNEGITLGGLYFDTMVASYVINPSERRHNMDDLAMHYLGYKTITFKELTGTGKNAIPITELPLDRLAEYAIEDADITWRLFEIFKAKLGELGLEKLFYDVEMPLVSILADIEYTGVKIDSEHFTKLAHQTDGMLAEREESIYKAAGQSFNINSTRELAVVLFEKCGLKPQKKTQTGYSTDISVLESLKGKHPIIDHLIAYRTLAKFKNTYIDTLPELVSEKTGRIHTSYNQTVVATGRLSSSDPNLQNIPVRDDYGKQIRKGFVPEAGFTLMSADYSQIELRLAAHLSDDANMIRAFREGIDIHRMTAASVYKVDMSGVTDEMRRQAKVINFATIYGVSPYGLSQQAEISIQDAAEFIRIYFETYPGFKKYIEATIAFARENGYVQTLIGRRRYIPEITSESKFPREGAERVAINTPIQGTSADMIKIAMIHIEGELKRRSLRTRMIMQVHDELVFEVKDDEKEPVEKLVREHMENAFTLSIPIVVDIGWGKNWEEAH